MAQSQILEATNLGVVKIDEVNVVFDIYQLFVYQVKLK